MQATPRPAQPQVVFTGTVRDQAARPVSGALVTLARTTSRTATRSDGTYRLVAPLARGREVTLVASRIGFATSTRTVRVSGDSVRVDFQLTAETLNLEGIVVNGTSAAPAHRRMTSVAAAPAASPPPNWNTESYSTIDENAFRAAAQHPLSTFSADVDRASYANVRRFLMEGQRPPKDAVRIEEMINYFPYAPPARRGNAPTTVATEVADAPWRAGHRLLRIGLSTPPVDLRGAPAGKLVFLFDVSG
jgi:Ca-activated chloride channel family protein